MEGTLVSILILGFLLGLKHAVETDHVAAVAAVVSNERNIYRSSVVGAAWGMGHTASLLLAGVVVLGFGLAIPENVSLSFEFLVGLMLVGLGIRGVIRAAAGVRLHRHVHEHRDTLHAHLHIHTAHPGTQSHEHRHLRAPNRSFWVGALHGLAGSGALTVLVVATVPSAAAGFGYLLIFGLGSILGMLLMSAVIGTPFALAAGRFEGIALRIQQGAGVASVAVGAMLAWEILRAWLA